MSRSRPSLRSPELCFAAFAVWWIALAIEPRYRADWFLENLPTFLLAPALWLGYRRRPLSNRAYFQIALFAALHTLGSHYTYSEVPLGDRMRDLFHLERNHYDRLVHFAFGVLMVRPIAEITIRDTHAVGPWAWRYLSLGGVAFCSVVYEIVEWLVAAIADPQAGTAFLGTQGDVWDAQKDMGLALVGACLGLLIDDGRKRRHVGKRGSAG